MKKELLCPFCWEKFFPYSNRIDVSCKECYEYHKERVRDSRKYGFRDDRSY